MRRLQDVKDDVSTRKLNVRQVKGPSSRRSCLRKHASWGVLLVSSTADFASL